MFTELRNDYYDEDECCYYIDGWLTCDDNESGITVAKVYFDNVVYTKAGYEELPEIIEIVNETKQFFN